VLGASLALASGLASEAQPVRSASETIIPSGFGRKRRQSPRIADATDQPVAVRGRPINGRLQVMDLEGHVAQSQLVGGGGRRTGQVVWPGEA
jgi:hypothetical protein